MESWVDLVVTKCRIVIWVGQRDVDDGNVLGLELVMA